MYFQFLIRSSQKKLKKIVNIFPNSFSEAYTFLIKNYKMKIGYFIQNYKRGGVNTFIKNLTSTNIYKDKIFIISNHNNPGIKFLKIFLKKYKIFNLFYFSWDTILNNKFHIIIINILKIVYSVFFPISFYLSNL